MTVHLEVSREVYTSALRWNDRLARDLRQDDAKTQGVSSQWFALSAFADGDYARAVDYCRYERAEYQRLAKTVLGGWVADLVAYVQAAEWSGDQAEHLLRAMNSQAWPRFERLADLALEDLELSCELGQRPMFESAQRQMREAHVASNDLAVRFIQDLMTAIGAMEGDAGVLSVLEVSYRNIWQPRYEAWFDLAGPERLALSAEGMRAHYSGEGRRGDFSIVERDDEYVMSFDPCGTGQVMRRGNDVREGVTYLPVVAAGAVKTPAVWNQDTPGMPYYCAHCPVLLEYFPLRDFGSQLRPVLFDLDPANPCVWLVPKAEVGRQPRPTLDGANANTIN